MMCRYLRYDELRPTAAGLVHQLLNLECLLSEAQATGRQVVLPPPHLSAAHNFGVNRAWKWDSYFDIAAGRLVDAAGTEHRLPILNGPPPSRSLPTLTLEPGESMPDRAPDCPLVVRRIEHSVFRDDVPPGEHRDLRLRLPPSRRVNDLARPVIAELKARGDGRFAAVHVRRGDRLALYPRWLTEPAQIRSHLRDQGIADGSVVFFLSDERDPSFWEELRGHYRAVRYTDHPELAALISRSAGRRPDNYLLYAVETEIMKNAWRRIESMPGGYQTNPHSTIIDERTWSFCFSEVRRTLVFRAERWLRRIANRVRRRISRNFRGGSPG